MQHTWYETNEHAVFVIYADKSLSPEVAATAHTLRIVLSGETTEIQIDHPFMLETIKRHQHKLEVFLKKTARGRWRDLTKAQNRHFERAREIEAPEETAHSPDPILNMFMDVYATATDEAKREMNKSFIESGGTELRTSNKPHSLEHHKPEHKS
ncbi:suppressor of G2 allele of SKP1 [Nematocida displodere]|uniref:Suppressor of G2 allele of SKP1 n=1 Tax=Nematocida displodere TaxID=1805483 RepID=A0A177EBG3_9MICR|nr:suppressor of G2 allele of SKP1 [Nematocida displodere]